MKKHLLLLPMLLICFSVFAQLNTRTLTWDGTARQYLEYVPSVYSGETPVPVVFCLHGLGDNMTNFSQIGFDNIADTANFIVITPQALVAYYMSYEIGTSWNSGASLYGIVPNADVDDSGFLMAILDSLQNHYNIDPERVFVMGFSMGGYMTNRLGSEHGDRIKAIASVSGTFGIAFTPDPVGPISSLHFHGTADETVPYLNNTSGMDAEELVAYWVDINNASQTPEVYNYPNTKPDGLTFERYTYTGGDNDTYDCFIKVVGGEHNWYYYPNNDIDYSIEIWRFFTNSMITTGIASVEHCESTLYPNPATDFINFDIAPDSNGIKSLQICDVTGRVLCQCKANVGSNHLDVSSLPSGVYLLIVNDNESLKQFRFVKK
ncbi:MAG: T9SS type A sorting domain-containing protein [Bacteroidales bacterium]|nr:T9SS type A sorting domain-containing protein [Bacteroidales bacterium]HOY38575.1 T9SS type A sorting domain-containing protein [Bacteroidales bacterium]HQP03269.1 T9SS type A sorting domain-containing protein [Bacteroidales bacterium]